MFAGKRILMLQGPVGPFFRRFAQDLEALDAKVFKVNFNGGDWLFFPSGAIAYKGGLAEWPEFLRNVLETWQIDIVILYGDCRPVHETVFKLQDTFRLDVYTFEEGYIRPDYITLEKGRANGYSSLPRNPIAYLNGPDIAAPDCTRIGYSFRHLALWGGLYHMAAALLRPVFPCHTYHRGIGLRELRPQLRSYWRKALYAWRDRGRLAQFKAALSGRYFLVPLQVNLDSQIKRHSDFSSDGMEGFILHVLESFARNAPEDVRLVFKHHPMDRGYHDYSRFIRKQARRLDLQGRVIYVHDLHLPTLINHARGVIVVNSTVGLSAILHGKPVKTCGKALYDMAGLTAPVGLDAFWRQAEDFIPDKNLVRRYNATVIRRTQINGNFYKRLPNTPLRCGLNLNRRRTAAPGTGVSESATAFPDDNQAGTG